MSKKILSALLAVLMIVSLLPTAVFAMADLSVAVTVDKAEYEKGDTVTATIKMSGTNADISGAQVWLHYDPAELTFVSVELGEFGNSFDGGKDFANIAASNYVNVRLDSLTSPVLNGEGVLAVVKFTIAGDSVSKFNLEVKDITNDEFDSYEPTVTQATITMKGAAIVPLTTIYIADVATGDGSGKDKNNLMGNDAAYAAAIASGTTTGTSSSGKAEEYKGSAIYKAWDALKETGGTIVVAGTVTVATGDATEGGKAANFYLPNLSKGAEIVVTGKTADDDFTSVAKIVLSSQYFKMRFHQANGTFGNNTSVTWDNLTFERTGSIDYFNFVLSGIPTVFGEGITATLVEGTPGYMDLYGAALWNGAKDTDGDGVAVDITIKGGKYRTVVGTSNFSTETKVIDGDVNISIENAELTGQIYGTGKLTDGNLGGKDSLQINGDFNLSVKNSTVRSIYAFNDYTCKSTSVNKDHISGMGNILGDANIYIGAGTNAQMIYLTSNAHKYSDSTTNMSHPYRYGQIAGNATVTVDGSASGAENEITFTRIDFGSMGFTNANSKFTIKFIGDNWRPTGTLWNVGASNQWGASFFNASGSNYFSASQQSATQPACYYGILDFSGMTYDQYWNHAYKVSGVDVKLNDMYRMIPGKQVTPANPPAGVTYYGSKSTSAYGFHEVIAPTDLIPQTLVVKTTGKTEYFTNEVFDNSGFVYTVTYTNGTFKDISGEDIVIDKTDAFVAGDTKVTASVKGFADVKTEIAVTVKVPTETLKSINVTTPAAKTAYIEGDKLDIAGLVVTATYAKEGSADIDKVIENAKLTFKPALDKALTIADTTVEISYSEAGVDKETSYAITVSAPALTSIEVKNPAAVKRDYYKGENLDLAGLVVVATYENGTTKEFALTDVTAAPANGTKLTNETAVTITFGGEDTTLPITVTEVTSIAIDEASLANVKSEYKPGEEADLSGLNLIINGTETVAAADLGSAVKVTSGEIESGDTEIQIEVKLGDYSTVLSIAIEVKNSIYDSMFTSWVMWVSKNLYTVTFVDHDGTVLATKQVAPYRFVVGPSNPTRAGYTFKGWDKNLDSVTSDMTVTAVYVENK